MPDETAIPDPATPVSSDEEPPPTVAVLTLREKHPAAARWMHWLNFPLLALLIWSGLSLSWVGAWSLCRLFPNGFYQRLGLTFSLAKGLSWHFFLMWFFVLNGLAYVIYT